MKKLFTVLTVALCLAFSSVAHADYPEKPLNMVIAFTAGGSSDVQARLMQKYWDKLNLPQWVFIYKTGAGGAIGFGEIAHAKKDGYVLGGINIPHAVLQPLAQHAQFTPKSLDYICQVVNDPQCIAVKKGSKFTSVKEIMDFAANNPGKLKLGIVGRFSGHHIMLLDVQDKYNFPVTDIVYKGSADQNAALLGEEVEVIFGNLNDVMRSLEHMDVLGIAAEKRNADFLPDVPTLKELGYDIVSDIRRAYVVPKGIDPAQLAFLREQFKKIATNPEYVAEMLHIGQPHEYMDGAEFEAYVEEQSILAEKILAKNNLLKKK